MFDRNTQRRNAQRHIVDKNSELYFINLNFPILMPQLRLLFRRQICSGLSVPMMWCCQTFVHEKKRFSEFLNVLYFQYFSMVLSIESLWKRY